MSQNNYFRIELKQFPTNPNPHHNLVTNENYPKITKECGDCFFYSLSMNSSAVGGSGERPFLFRVSAIRFAWIDFGIGVQALK